MSGPPNRISGAGWSESRTAAASSPRLATPVMISTVFLGLGLDHDFSGRKRLDRARATTATTTSSFHLHPYHICYYCSVRGIFLTEGFQATIKLPEVPPAPFLAVRLFIVSCSGWLNAFAGFHPGTTARRERIAAMGARTSASDRGGRFLKRWRRGGDLA